MNVPVSPRETLWGYRTEPWELVDSLIDTEQQV